MPPRTRTSSTTLRAHANAEGDFTRVEPIASPVAFRAAPVGADTPAWAADQDSPCYRHVGAAFSATPFMLTASMLETLATLNGFAGALDDSQKVLFGLRGCEILGSTWTDARAAVAVCEAVPDHGWPRCVLGVWDRQAATVGLVQGSTVPGSDYMADFVDGKQNANMLPTGCYRYVTGAHHPGQTNEIPGVWRLEDKVLVIRSQDDLVFTTGDLWPDPAQVFDNIHPAGKSSPYYTPQFWSAGCQTVVGQWTGGKTTGPWAQLRFLAGLAATPTSTEYGQVWRYMLLTGREARLVGALPDHTSLRRLRMGSRGEAVKKLQSALGVTSDGFFGNDTGRALLNWQSAQGRPTDMIVTPEVAAALGVTLVPS